MVALELRSGFYRPAEEVRSKRRLRERSSVGEEGEIGHGSVSPRAAGEVATGGWSVRRGRAGRGTARGGSGSRGQGVTRGGGGEAGVGRRPAQSGGRRGDVAAASKQRGRQGKGKKGQFAISNNSRDQNVKPTITFNIGLK